MIEAGTKLRVIGRAGIGVDTIDVDAATRRGIIVMNTPQANTTATCEHTIAMMLALARNIPQADASLRRGEWTRSKFMGEQLMGKTLGVIGLGRIGTQVAKRAQAFGMEVIAFDPYVSEEAARVNKIGLVELDELLARSDFITLHSSLNPGSRRLLDAAAIAKMKTGARMINVARGALVDADALHAALTSGKLAGAALDVFEEEPPPPITRCSSCPMWCVTPAPGRQHGRSAARRVDPDGRAGARRPARPRGAQRGQFPAHRPGGAAGRPAVPEAGGEAGRACRPT